jgi:hypothetical protein
MKIIREVKKMSSCSRHYLIKCYDMKKYGGGIAPPFLTSALDESQSSALRPFRFAPPPGESGHRPTGLETGLAPEPVWTLWSR